MRECDDCIFFGLFRAGAVIFYKDILIPLFNLTHYYGTPVLQAEEPEPFVSRNINKAGFDVKMVEFVVVVHKDFAQGIVGQGHGVARLNGCHAKVKRGIKVSFFYIR